ncbi:hypothetical protein [Lewinella sp. 4G2]|uniref:hypothetical protein n=1 Tax=Lewinella sp. 4G2 TaxID=1803372 RepID=UPI0007B4A8B6|nr:hypothetical protein [Lewinella sp. 4G2]OAV42878.1 hypothetical protein A3850_016765 [Lewinella sp. 4G2]
MKELNKRTLHDGLNALPQHDPAPGVWREIDRQLTPSLGDRLPSYQPPPAVWNGLAEELSRAEAAPQPAATVTRPLRKLPLRWLSVAAAFLLTLGIAYTVATADGGPTVTYAFNKEVAPSTQPVQDWDDDEESFARVLAQLEAINEPELNTMRMELEELTEAKEEVKAVLVAYGDDPAVVRQLAAIERDRSEIYRRIIVRI